jgi:hypothetical protein
MKAATNQIVEFRGIDAKAFRDVVFAEYRPAVLRGMVSDWPAVAHSIQSRESIGQYLSACDSGTPVDTLMMAPHLKGRQFYSDDMRGFNFRAARRRSPKSPTSCSVTPSSTIVHRWSCRAR